MYFRSKLNAMYDQNGQRQPASGNKGIIIGLSLVASLAFGAFLIWLTAMYTQTVEPGQHGVIVDKPYFWGNEGVRQDVLKEGRMLLWRTSSVQPVRMTPQAVQVKFDDLSSADNILLDFDATIQYKFTDAVALVRDFGVQDWFEANVLRQFMAVVREAVKKKTMTQMMSDVAAASEVDKEVTDALQKLVVESKLPLSVLGVSLGRAQPNANVLAQMNETAAQQQRKKTLIEAEAAEIQREREQIAKAKADNAYRNSIGMSPEQFIELEKIKRYAAACEKTGNTCIIGTAGVNVNAK